MLTFFPNSEKSKSLDSQDSLPFKPSTESVDEIPADKQLKMSNEKKVPVDDKTKSEKEGILIVHNIKF